MEANGLGLFRAIQIYIWSVCNERVLVSQLKNLEPVLPGPDVYSANADSWVWPTPASVLVSHALHSRHGM